MSRSRAALLALSPFVLHAVAREVDRALGLVLRAELPPANLLGELARALALEWPAGLLRVGLWLGAGVLVWRLRAARGRGALGGFGAGSHLAPLCLRPAITLLALASVALDPSYPYAFTLPVALTQDWGIGQDAATLAVILAAVLPRLSLPAPRVGEVFLISFLAYASLAPDWAWVWDSHPGNEPKYLRQAVALGHELTFDAEGVSAAMEDLPTRPLRETLARAVRTLTRESARMLAAAARAEAGRDAIRARRITRQTIRGKEGGVYYVLAPGPSLALAPALRLDRALNQARGIKGRLAVAVLSWCALAALLVVAVFSLVRDATARPGLAAALAFAFALLPPLLFYSFQFYPEMPGALVLSFAFGTLALRPERLSRRPWLMGCLLALLPWLHQKFLPVWAVLVATAVAAAYRRSRSGAASSDAASAGHAPRLARVLVGLLVPQAVSLYLTALYNFAITGSLRPDALFLAWGPGGVTSSRIGQGLLGLLLDARYGILPYVPLLAVGGAGLLARRARPFATVIPSAAVYYLTVASADNWAGAVSNIGRYVMPLVPLAIVLVGLALAGEAARPSAGTAKDAVGQCAGLARGGLALALVLAAWSALVAVALWKDPHAANDSALLLAKSAYADGNRYIPNLFVRHWSQAEPGLWTRIAAWLAALALVALSLRRAVSPARVAFLVFAVGLGLGFVLERWPGPRAAPAFPNALAAGRAGLVFFEGQAQLREGEVVLGPGRVELLRRTYAEGPTTPADASPLRATVGGTGLLKLEGRPPIALRQSGAVVDLGLIAYHVLNGGDGRRAQFSRLGLTVCGQAVMRFADGHGPPAGARAAPRAVPDENAELDSPGSR